MKNNAYKMMMMPKAKKSTKKKVKYCIKGALNGSFGGTKDLQGEIIEFNDLGSDDANFEYAEKQAYQVAIDVYESYEGRYNIHTVQEIMEKDGVNETEAEQIYIEEREEWLEYDAICVSPTTNDKEK